MKLDAVICCALMLVAFAGSSCGDHTELGDPSPWGGGGTVGTGGGGGSGDAGTDTDPDAGNDTGADTDSDTGMQDPLDCAYNDGTCSDWCDPFSQYPAEEMTGCLITQVCCLPTDEEYLCLYEPNVCEDVGTTAYSQNYGCCLYNMVFWCDASSPGVLQSSDCAADGLLCGYDPPAATVGCI